jgi:hypothetical protein
MMVTVQLNEHNCDLSGAFNGRALPEGESWPIPELPAPLTDWGARPPRRL